MRHLPLIVVLRFFNENINLYFNCSIKECFYLYMSFSFKQVPNKNVEQRIVKVTVLDSDRGKHHIVIGHSFFPLKDIDLTSNEMVVLWKDLAKDAEDVVSMIQFSLSLNRKKMSLKNKTGNRNHLIRINFETFLTLRKIVKSSK